MIRTCKSCKNVCCKTGPGRYRLVDPATYLENFGTSEAYNTKCMALDHKDRCRLWGTKDFPQECRTYVCQSRSYSLAELAKIESVEDRKCPQCGCEWMLYAEVDSKIIESCEACGHAGIWRFTEK